MLTSYSAMAADIATSPKGEEVFDALLNSLNIPLSEEPLCNMESITRKNPKKTLGQHFSFLLALSYDNNDISTIKSSCQLSKYESSDSKLLEGGAAKLIHMNRIRIRNLFLVQLSLST